MRSHFPLNLKPRYAKRSVRSRAILRRTRPNAKCIIARLSPFVVGQFIARLSPFVVGQFCGVREETPKQNPQMRSALLPVIDV